MSQQFYSGLAAVATQLLTDKGQVVSFARETSSGFDPVLGVNTSTPSVYTGNGAAFDYNTNEIDGTIIKMGDIRLILEAVTNPPLIGDIATIDSIDYRVMNVKTTSPGGTVVMYEVQLRK